MSTRIETSNVENLDVEIVSACLVFEDASYGNELVLVIADDGNRHQTVIFGDPEIFLLKLQAAIQTAKGDAARKAEAPQRNVSHDAARNILAELKGNMTTMIYHHSDQAVREAILWSTLLETCNDPKRARLYGFLWMTTQQDVITAIATLQRFTRIFGKATA